MLNKIFYRHYVFLEQINNLIEKNILKFNNISIIIDIDHNNNKNLEEENSIIQFAKKYKIPCNKFTDKINIFLPIMKELEVEAEQEVHNI